MKRQVSNTRSRDLWPVTGKCSHDLTRFPNNWVYCFSVSSIWLKLERVDCTERKSCAVACIFLTSAEHIEYPLGHPIMAIDRASVDDKMLKSRLTYQSNGIVLVLHRARPRDVFTFFKLSEIHTAASMCFCYLGTYVRKSNFIHVKASRTPDSPLVIPPTFQQFREASLLLASAFHMLALLCVSEPIVAEGASLSTFTAQ